MRCKEARENRTTGIQNTESETRRQLTQQRAMSNGRVLALPEADRYDSSARKGYRLGLSAHHHYRLISTPFSELVKKRMKNC